MSRYYKAGKKIGALCDDIESQRDIASKKARRLSRKYGASRTTVITSTSWFGALRFTGFLFNNEAKVDKKVFKRCRSLEDGWLPRLSTKKGKEIDKELSALNTDDLSVLMKAIGMKAWMGVSVRLPGIQRKNGTWYLAVPDDVTAKGCRRISDIQYEKAVKSGK